MPKGIPAAAERPISFNSQMARAILDGRKKQTRRIVLEELADCPFGAVGDRLWVREPSAFRPSKNGAKEKLVYAADLTNRSGLRWRASYLMRRAESRMLIEIVQTRTERLSRISRADAIAEGFDASESSLDPVKWFAQLWDSLSGKDPSHKFAADPLVWVIEFRVVERAAVQRERPSSRGAGVPRVPTADCKQKRGRDAHATKGRIT